MIDPELSPPRPTPVPARTLRQFAGLWLVFFGGLACWERFARGGSALGWAALALAIGGMGFVNPAAIRPLFVALTRLTYPIGWVVSRMLLALLYYGLFTPIALVFKLLRRDALTLRVPRRDGATHWSPKPMPAEIRSYLRQS